MKLNIDELFFDDSGDYRSAAAIEDRARDALIRLEQENALLTAELERYRNGYQGSCYACEPVGMLNQRLRELIGEFFKLLDTVEESDSGREFHPVQITCCRTMMMEPLNKVLKEMKEQVQ